MEIKMTQDPKLKACELRECPFCGAIPELKVEKASPTLGLIDCAIKCKNNCGNFWGYDVAGITKAWNSRKSEQGVLERVLEEVSQRLELYKGNPDYEHGLTDAELVFKQIIERLK